MEKSLLKIFLYITCTTQVGSTGFCGFFIRHDWKLKIPTVGVKIFSSILAEYSALTQVSNALYRLVSDSRAVKMEGNAGDEEGMFSDIRKDYSCF